MRQGRKLGLGGMEFSLLAVGRGLGHRLKLWTGLQNGIKGPAELAAPPILHLSAVSEDSFGKSFVSLLTPI